MPKNCPTAGKECGIYGEIFIDFIFSLWRLVPRNREQRNPSNYGFFLPSRGHDKCFSLVWRVGTRNKAVKLYRRLF